MSIPDTSVGCCNFHQLANRATIRPVLKEFVLFSVQYDLSSEDTQKVAK